MASLYILSLITAATSVLAIAGSPNVYAQNIRTPCHGDTLADNFCCSLSPARVLQSQVWDTRPVAGPLDSWTIHGLWPASLPFKCDTNRTYTNITQLLHHAGAEETLHEMNKYWVAAEGTNEKFWEDQWAGHGTCFSTLDPACFSEYDRAEEAIVYFQRTISLFKTLPTYEWLREAGIVPSYSRKYELAGIQAVLEKHHGAPVTFRCAGKRLHEIGYHFNVTGSLQFGDFESTSATGQWGECPDEVLYEPKGETRKATFNFDTFHPHTAMDVEDL
ncbi:hypothetical protein F66182_2513 [Fusarium sp. NRRL 66182]|nr:hypothetical protein F66182_2513 [Fusarium sp. NRRL 66182]